MTRSTKIIPAYVALLTLFNLGTVAAVKSIFQLTICARSSSASVLVSITVMHIFVHQAEPAARPWLSVSTCTNSVVVKLPIAWTVTQETVVWPWP